MKRWLSILLSVILLVSLFVMPTAAAEPQTEPQTTTTIEMLDDGSYFVIEIQENPATRSPYYKSGTKTATYYNADDVAIYSIKVTGVFEFDYVTCEATSATGTVTTYVTGVSLVDKYAYTDGNAAIAEATISYQGVRVYRGVTLRCDNTGILY
jgi:hypothetical protein